MANHVSSYITFHNLSEEGKAKLEELYQRLSGIDDDSTYEYSAHEIFGIPEPEGDDTDGPGYYSWNIEHMGAKWCYIEDPDEDRFRTNSAWSVPWDLFDYVCKEIATVDENLFADVTYEDEMPNFVGWATWHHGSFDEGREWEWEAIEDWIMDNNPEIDELFDREEREWKEGKEDEGRDLMWDVQWEFMEDVRDHTLQEEVTWYFEHEEEILEELEEAKREEEA